MDSFVEQIVPIKKSPVERFIQIGTIVLGVLLIVACGLLYVMHVLGMLSILLAAAAVAIGFGVYYLCTQLNLEYEYIFTNGDLDVDKITAKRSRKRVLSIHCRFASEFGKYNPDAFSNRSFAERIVACTVDENAYYAVFSLNEDGEALLIFSPNDKLYDAMRKYAPRVMKNDISRN